MPDINFIGSWASTALGVIIGLVFAVKAIQLFAEDKYGKFFGLVAVGILVTWIVIDFNSFSTFLGYFRPKTAA